MKSKYTRKYKKNTIQKQLNVLKRTLAPERKYIGTSNIAQSFDHNGLVFELSAANQGSGDNERIANKVQCQSVSVKGQVRMNTSIQSTTVRIVVFSDNDNGGTISMADYLENVGSAVAPYEPYNRNNIKRFRTHYSKLYTLNEGGSNTLPINVYKKLRHALHYKGALAGNAGVGRVFMGIISGQTGSTEPVIDYITRFTYTDA